MSLLNKFFSTNKSLVDYGRKKSCNNDKFVTPTTETQQDRNHNENFGPDRVRVLLFRECERRGRKLLFDSLTLTKRRCKNQISLAGSLRDEDHRANKARDSEKDISPEDDVSLLSEMVFGTVAMTYRGPSLKVHSMTSPACIMCTKVFPATDHNSTCWQSERLSDEALSDSNSGHNGVRMSTSPIGKASSANLSSTDSNLRSRKDSTCSSIGNGWDIDISTTIGHGSLSSLRRRWFRAYFTSLNRFDPDDALGMHHWSENSHSDVPGKRHKTRLGLAMLLCHTGGHDSQTETRLLEHMAFLEGMLDRLRYFGIERKHLRVNARDDSKRTQLAERMQRDISRFVISLLRFLMSVGSVRTPLLWHDVLLNSVITVEEKTNRVFQGLEKMCQLLDDVDTKSTNFFLSTIMTAVLTYHLGWVYTVLPRRDLEMMQKWSRCCPSNSLWAQLGDLYGALGNPLKIVQTVVAADICKTDLINSVLSFLSYFIRSGVIKKHKESRCSIQEDFDRARQILERRDNLRNRSIVAGGTSSMEVKKLSPSKRNCAIVTNLDEHSSSSKAEVGLDECDKPLSLKIEFDAKKDELFLPKGDFRCEEFDVVDPVQGELFESAESQRENKLPQVFFTVGSEEKQQEQKRLRQDGITRTECRCFRNFIGVPSTSAHLPEEVFRKIIQRNFPESKSVQSSSNSTGVDSENVTFCLRCHGTGQGYESSFKRDVTKQLLETPTNATEVLRTCGNMVSNRTIDVSRSNSFKALMEANSVVELPMPRSRKISLTKTTKEEVGFTKTLLQRKLMREDTSNPAGSGYTWGLVAQGFIKRSRKKKKREKSEDRNNGNTDKNHEKDEESGETNDWWWPAREEMSAIVKFPMIDQPISEAFCILGDLDTWQVGLISNNTPFQSQPIPVGMSRLVSNMLEAFAYVWRKYHSPVHCVQILESRLKEMWLRSEALAELLMSTEPCDADLTNLTIALDLDASDVPLLLAVATTHSPQIAQRFGLSFV